jgi:hypothetical protein
MSSAINTVNSNASNINSVASNISNVNAVASNESNINSVVAAASNITAVAGNQTNIDAVAGNATNINTVAGNNTNINTVAGANTNIGTVATNIANVNTTASNITDVNTFANQYRIGSSDPSSSLDEGDLFYNTTSNQLKYYNGSAWVAIVSDTDVKVSVSANDTTPGFLNGKLVAGSNISFTEGSDGGNETLTIAATATGASLDDATALAIALG